MTDSRSYRQTDISSYFDNGRVHMHTGVHMGSKRWHTDRYSSEEYYDQKRRYKAFGFEGFRVVRQTLYGWGIFYRNRYRQTKISSYRPNHLMFGYTEKAWSRMPATRATFDDLPKEIQCKIMADRARQQVKDVTLKCSGYLIEYPLHKLTRAKLISLCHNNFITTFYKNDTKNELLDNLNRHHKFRLTNMGFFWLGRGRLGMEANDNERKYGHGDVGC